MAKVKLVQTDFTTGEISPKMIAINMELNKSAMPIHYHMVLAQVVVALLLLSISLIQLKM